MFRSLLLFLSVVILSAPARAFGSNRGLPVSQAGRLQSHFSPETSVTDGATKIIDLILETVGLQATFEIRRADVPNAAAVMYQGKRYILYNPSFILAMDKAAGTPWASVAILAHEVGHHLNGHTLDGEGSMPDIELEADAFSGFALRKMGASLSEAQVAMRIIASAKATRTHPARNERLLAIANGWNHANDQLNSRDIASIPPTGESGPEERQLHAEKHLVFDVYFNFDPQTTYHVTLKNNLVKLLNNKLYVLGKLLSTGTPGYPMAFQTGPEDFLLISRTGKIINKNGRVLGYITPRN